MAVTIDIIQKAFVGNNKSLSGVPERKQQRRGLVGGVGAANKQCLSNTQQILLLRPDRTAFTHSCTKEQPEPVAWASKQQDLTLSSCSGVDMICIVVFRDCVSLSVIKLNHTLQETQVSPVNFQKQCKLVLFHHCFNPLGSKDHTNIKVGQYLRLRYIKSLAELNQSRSTGGPHYKQKISTSIQIFVVGFFTSRSWFVGRGYVCYTAALVMPTMHNHTDIFGRKSAASAIWILHSSLLPFRLITFWWSVRLHCEPEASSQRLTAVTSSTVHFN